MSNPKIVLIVEKPFLPEGAAAPLAKGDIYDHRDTPAAALLSLIENGHLTLNLPVGEDLVTANAQRAEREAAFIASLKKKIAAHVAAKDAARREREAAEAAAAQPLTAKDAARLRAEITADVVAAMAGKKNKNKGKKTDDPAPTTDAPSGGGAII